MPSQDTDNPRQDVNQRRRALQASRLRQLLRPLRRGHGRTTAEATGQAAEGGTPGPDGAGPEGQSIQHPG